MDGGSYRVATEYMIQLEREDMEDQAKLAPIAATAKLAPAEFTRRYGYLVGMGPDASTASWPGSATPAAGPDSPAPAAGPEPS